MLTGFYRKIVFSIIVCISYANVFIIVYQIFYYCLHLVTDRYTKAHNTHHLVGGAKTLTSVQPFRKNRCKCTYTHFFKRYIKKE